MHILFIKKYLQLVLFLLTQFHSLIIISSKVALEQIYE